jgi:thioredoxin-like negative regulator of GroEL
VEDFVVDFHRRAETAIRRGDLREAEDRFIFILNIGGANADAYYGLARVAVSRGQRERAQVMLRRCLEVDPDHQQARRLLEQIRPLGNTTDGQDAASPPQYITGL